MRLTEHEVPNIGSYWLNERGQRVRVMMVTNLHAKKEQWATYPLTVAYRDRNNDLWSLPVDQWYTTMTAIQPSAG